IQTSGASAHPTTAATATASVPVASLGKSYADGSHTGSASDMLGQGWPIHATVVHQHLIEGERRNRVSDVEQGSALAPRRGGLGSGAVGHGVRRVRETRRRGNRARQRPGVPPTSGCRRAPRGRFSEAGAEERKAH